MQVRACECFCLMADYIEFEEQLSSTSVLNFLCIALNCVQECEELVCRIFEKLSRRPENLVILMEGSVGDILETYFKTSYQRVATLSAAVQSARTELAGEQNHPRGQIRACLCCGTFHYCSWWLRS